MVEEMLANEAAPYDGTASPSPPPAPDAVNAQLDTSPEQLQTLQQELTALKKAFADYSTRNMPEIEQVKQQLRSATAERDNVAGELEKLRRHNAIKSLAAQYGFTDPEYLDFVLQKNQIAPDKSELADSFMQEFRKSNPRYFALPVKSGSGSRPGNAPVSGAASNANCRMDALEELLSSAPEIV